MLRRMRERAWRGYVADSLHYAPQGKYLGAKLGDLLDPKPAERAEDIIGRVIASGDLEVV